MGNFIPRETSFVWNFAQTSNKKSTARKPLFWLFQKSTKNAKIRSRNRAKRFWWNFHHIRSFRPQIERTRSHLRKSYSMAARGPKTFRNPTRYSLYRQLLLFYECWSRENFTVASSHINESNETRFVQLALSVRPPGGFINFSVFNYLQLSRKLFDRFQPGFLHSKERPNFIKSSIV